MPPTATDFAPVSTPGRSTRQMRQNALRDNCAFTLVETVMALGIVSFAMLSILGLIPVGLDTFRKAMNLTVESTIVQSVANDLLRTDYTALSGTAYLNGTNYSYDVDGGKVADNSVNKIYTARILPPRNLDAAGLVDSLAAKTVVIEVGNIANPNVKNSYFVIVPRNN